MLQLKRSIERGNKYKTRTRCRICGRHRYLRYLRSSVTYNNKWMCQDDVECLGYYNYKNSIK